MKKFFALIFNVVLAGLLLAGCNNIFVPVKTAPADEPASAPGMGIVKIAFGDGVHARNLLPSVSFDNYVFTFTNKANNAQKVETVQSGQAITFSLDAGTYALDVKAYKGSVSAANLAATAAVDPVVVQAGQALDLNIKLQGAAVEAGGNGYFSYTIKYPGDAQIVIKLDNIDLTANAVTTTSGSVKTITNTVTVPAGYRIFILNIIKPDGSYTGDVDVAEIYKNTTVYYGSETGGAKDFSTGVAFVPPEESDNGGGQLTAQQVLLDEIDRTWQSLGYTAKPTKYVALSLDDGPSGNGTYTLLDLLDEKHVTATFFVIGSNIRSQTAAAQAIYNRGHELGNHSDGYTDLGNSAVTTIRTSLTTVSDLIRGITGKDPVIFRAPNLNYGNNLTTVTRELGLAIIGASPMSGDYSGISAQQIVNNISGIQNWGIICSHEPNSATNSVAGARATIDWLRQNGFWVTSVGNLAILKGGVPEAGVQYDSFATLQATTPQQPVAVTGVSLSPKTVSVGIGAAATLTAAIVPTTATNKAVTWSSGNNAVATVSSSGVVTGVSVGSATITATTTDGGKTDTAAVTVTQSYNNTGTTVTSWQGFTTAQTGGSGGTAPTWTQYNNYADATGNYTNVLRIVPPSAGYSGWGHYAMYYASTTGTVNIKAQVWVERSASYPSEPVTVYWQGRGTGYPAAPDAENTPLTEDQFGKWVSIDQTFTLSNLPFALMGGNSSTASENKGLRHATIYIRDVRLTVGSNVVIGPTIYPTSISIKEKPVTGSLSFANDVTQQLALTFAPDDTTYKTVTWSSSNTSIATVNASGLVTPVTGATGSVNIIVTGRDETGNALTDSIPLQITAAPVRVRISAGTGITITDGGVTAATNAITIGDKRTVTATVSGGSGDYEIRWFASATENTSTVTSNNVARLKAATGASNEVRAIGYTNAKGASANEAGSGGTGGVMRYTGTGSVQLYARAYQGNTRVGEPAVLTVNTTTAADTSKGMSNFNIGAVFNGKFEIGGITGPSQSDLTSMGFTTVTDANGLKPASTAANLNIQVGGTATANNLTYNSDTTSTTSISNYQKLSGARYGNTGSTSVALSGTVSASRPSVVTATSGIKLHGHTLIWHESVPSWQRLLADAAVYTETPANFADAAAQRTAQENMRANALYFLETYIKGVVNHSNFTLNGTYLVASWDVLNEVFGESGAGNTKHWTQNLSTKPWSGADPSWFTKLRKDAEPVTAGINDYPHTWWHSIGPDYVYWAFYFARKYTPAGVQLVYNDYNLDVDGTKGTNAISLMTWVNNQYNTKKAADPSHDLGADKSKLVDVLGLQAHYNAADGGVYNNVSGILTKARNAGFHVVVSELTGQAYDWSPEYNSSRYSTNGSGAQTHFEMLPRYAEGHTDADGNLRGEMTARREMNQAFIFAEAFRAYAAYSDIVDRVTFFGLSGGLTSYRPYCYPFDGSSRPKPIVYAIMDYVQFCSDHSGRPTDQWPKIAAQGGSGKNENQSSDFY